MLRTFAGRSPKIHPTAFVHDSAEIIGDVVIGPKASIFPGCVLRGDIAQIRIGARANIQDLTVIHTRAAFPTIVDEGVTVGHRVVLHGCRIGRQALIGMGAVVMEASIGARALIGAGALIPAGMSIPTGRLALGSPARIVRPLRRDELKMLAESERSYIVLAQKHKNTSTVIF
jgi:carbonic anhydrase/acetyltransferase-like protein (isoleucine patch superfamily)